MGCDIHAYLEREIDGEWVLLGPCSALESRDYDFFSRIADVRTRDSNEIGYDPIEALGLPHSVSKGVQWHADRGGKEEHSHSYMGPCEMLAHKKAADPEYVVGLWELGITESEEEERSEIMIDAIYRVVFWFDN